MPRVVYGSKGLSKPRLQDFAFGPREGLGSPSDASFAAPTTQSSAITMLRSIMAGGCTTTIVFRRPQYCRSRATRQPVLEQCQCTACATTTAGAVVRFTHNLPVCVCVGRFTTPKTLGQVQLSTSRSPSRPPKISWFQPTARAVIPHRDPTARHSGKQGNAQVTKFAARTVRIQFECGTLAEAGRPESNELVISAKREFLSESVLPSLGHLLSECIQPFACSAKGTRRSATDVRRGDDDSAPAARGAEPLPLLPAVAPPV